MIFLIASLLALGSPAMVAASDPAAAPVAAPATQEKPKKEKKVCRPDALTYSRIPKMICKTAAEWQESDAARDSRSEPEVRRQ
jgi:hypothetical protein